MAVHQLRLSLNSALTVSCRINLCIAEEKEPFNGQFVQSKSSGNVEKIVSPDHASQKQ